MEGRFFKKKPTLDEYQAILPELSGEECRDQITHLPERYFLLFPHASLAHYARLLASLSDEQPFRTEVVETGPREIEVRVIAYDRHSLFALVAGALSAGGVNIGSGDIFTYLDEVGAEPTARNGNLRRDRRGRPGTGFSPPASGGTPRKKVVDVFRGDFGEEEKSSFAVLTEELGRILDGILGILYGDLPASSTPADTGASTDRARERLAEELSRQLIDRRERDSPPKMYPIEMEVEDTREGSTKLQVRSQDTPFFLYAFGTVLALHGISIEHVAIKTGSRGIEDTFFVRTAVGRPITDEKLLGSLKLSILFTKQFTHFLWNAPDPYRALTRFETLVRDLQTGPEDGSARSLVADPKVLRRLSRLLGASDFLWEDFIRLQYENIIPLLSHERVTAGIDTSKGGLQRELRQKLEDAGDFEEKKRVLNEFKDRFTYLVDLEHILDPGADFLYLSDRLSDIAELVVRGAFDIAWAHLTGIYGEPRTVADLPTEYAVTGLGKFGGRAIGYASDIELLVFYRDAGETAGPKKVSNTEFFIHLVRAASLMIESKREGIYQVDLRLRPHGSGGPLAVSLSRFVSYYRDEASSLEKLALVRLRAVAGDVEFGEQVERIRDTLLYEGGTIDIEELIRRRKSQADKYGSRQGPNVKYGPGGLIDLEYSLQILQVIEGAHAPELRTPYLHEVFRHLSERGTIDKGTAVALEKGYYFLRRLINALRMLRGNALDLYLPERGASEFFYLARRMGYRDEEGVSGEDQLWIDFQKNTAMVRSFVEQRLGPRAVEKGGPGNIADLLLGGYPLDEEVRGIFAGVGFHDTSRAYSNFMELYNSWPEKQQFIELALFAWDYLRRSPDPDMALNNWERFTIAHPKGSDHFVEVARQPKRLEILLRICGAGSFLADLLTCNPDFFSLVTDPEMIRVPMGYRDFYGELTKIREGDSGARAGEGIEGEEGGSPDPEQWRRELRKFRYRHILRIGSRDICYGAPLVEVTGELSSLAEAIVQGALDYRLAEFSAAPGTAGPAMVKGASGVNAAAGGAGSVTHKGSPTINPEALCILAFGKLGGGELNYSSDIDLVVIYDPGGDRIGDNERKHLHRLVRRIRGDIADITGDGMVYRVDFRLRPYGNSGELVFTPRQMEEYYTRAAALWEFQALLKARPLAGNRRLGQDLLEKIYTGAFSRLDPGEILDSVLKARRSREVDPTRGINVKEDPGGIRDIEFLTQALQLIHAGQDRDLITGNTLEALSLLVERGLLEQEIARQLRGIYRFLRRIEHFLQLLEDRQEHRLPTDPRALEALGGRMRWTNVCSGNFSEHLHSNMKMVDGIFLTILEKTRTEPTEL